MVVLFVGLHLWLQMLVLLRHLSTRIHVVVVGLERLLHGRWHESWRWNLIVVKWSRLSLWIASERIRRISTPGIWLLVNSGGISVDNPWHWTWLLMAPAMVRLVRVLLAMLAIAWPGLLSVAPVLIFTVSLAIPIFALLGRGDFPLIWLFRGRNSTFGACWSHACDCIALLWCAVDEEYLLGSVVRDVQDLRSPQKRYL